jgi:hypothetical protein
VQAYDHVVIGRHVGPELFWAARNSPENPATRVHDVALNVVPLAQNPRQHSLPARDVGGRPGLREPGGNECGGDLESPLVTVEPVRRHCADPSPDRRIQGRAALLAGHGSVGARA